MTRAQRLKLIKALVETPKILWLSPRDLANDPTTVVTYGRLR